MAKNIGVVQASFSLDTREARKGMQDIERTIKGRLQGSLKALAGDFGTVGTSLTRMGPAGIAAGAALGGLAVTIGAVAAITKKSLREAMQFADNLDNLANKTGLSTRALQIYKVAAEESGASIEAVSTASLMLQKNIINGTSEAAKGARILGVSFDELREKSPDEQLAIVLDRLKQVPNHSDKAAAAMLLLGRSGAALIGVAESAKDFETEMTSLNQIMSEDSVAAADKLDKQVARLGRTWNAMFLEFGGTIAQSPELQKALDELTVKAAELVQIVIDNKDNIIDFVDSLVSGTRTLVEDTKILIGWVRKLIDLYDRIPTLSDITGASFVRDFIGDKIGEHFTGGGGSSGSGQSVTDFLLSQTFGAGGGGNRPGDGASMPTQPLFSFPQRDPFFFGANQRFADRMEADRSNPAFSIFGSRLEHDPLREALEAAGVGKPLEPLDLDRRGQFDLKKIIDDMKEAEKETVDYSQTLQDLANQFVLLGIDADSALGRIVAGVGQLAAAMPAILDFNKSILGNDKLSTGSKFAQGGVAAVGGVVGVINATGSGSTGARAAGGALAGAGAGGQIAGPIGAAVGAAAGALVGFFRGNAMDKFQDTVEREVGFRMSRGLAEAIKESGEIWQLHLGDMFREGIEQGLSSADDLAREVGDLFSMFERGDISEGEILGALQNAIPVLIENFAELGPAGEEQIERITSAAERLGIEFEGLGDLMQASFAPATLEQMAEQFGITIQEARELAKTMGVDVQTNLERAAAQANLSVEEFKALSEAINESMDKEGAASIEEVLGFLEAMGLSAQQAADILGIDVADGAESASGEAEKTEEHIGGAADQASRLADELARAARESGKINIPNSGGGTGEGVPEFAKGGIVKAPTLARIGESPEVVTPVAALFGQFADVVAAKVGSGGGDLSAAELNQINAQLAVLPKAIARAIDASRQRSL